MTDPHTEAEAAKEPAISVNRFEIKSAVPSSLVTVKELGQDVQYSCYEFRTVFGRACNFGLIGEGFIGKFIKQCIPGDQGQLITCCPKTSGLDKAAGDYAETVAGLGLSEDQIVDAYMKVIENPEVDVVIIATPNHNHFEIAKAALEAGKHVFCEKPATFTLAEAQQLQEVATSTGLAIYFNHIYSQYSMISNLASVIRMPDADRKLVLDPERFDDGLGLGLQPFDVTLGALQRDGIKGGYPQEWIYHDIKGFLSSEKFLKAHCANWQSPTRDEIEKGIVAEIWRLDPNKTGASYVFGDIGSHVLDLLAAAMDTEPVGITGQISVVKEVVINMLVGGRHEPREFSLPLDVAIKTRAAFANGQTAQVEASGIKRGSQNDPWIQFDFEGGSLYFSTDNANQLTLKSDQIPNDVSQLILKRHIPPFMGSVGGAEVLMKSPFGHHEGHDYIQWSALQGMMDRVCRWGIQQDGTRDVVGKPKRLHDMASAVGVMRSIHQVGQVVSAMPQPKWMAAT